MSARDEIIDNSDAGKLCGTPRGYEGPSASGKAASVEVASAGGEAGQSVKNEKGCAPLVIIVFFALGVMFLGCRNEIKSGGSDVWATIMAPLPTVGPPPCVIGSPAERQAGRSNVGVPLCP